jgi:hypothetical protein
LLLHRAKGPVHLLLLLLLFFVLPFLDRHADLRAHVGIVRLSLLGKEAPPAPTLLLLLLLLLVSTTPASAALLLLLLLLAAAAPAASALLLLLLLLLLLATAATKAVAIGLVALGFRVRDDGALVDRLVDEDPLVDVPSEHGSQGYGRGKEGGQDHARELHDLLG